MERNPAGESSGEPVALHARILRALEVNWARAFNKESRRELPLCEALSFLSAWAGLWLLNPAVSIFNTSPAVHDVLGPAPEWWWGLALLSSAIAERLGARRDDARLRRFGASSLLWCWGLICAAYLHARPTSAGSIFLPWVVFCWARIVFRMEVLGWSRARTS